MTFSVVPVWIVEDDKGNQYGVCYSNEEANRIRSALVKAAELQTPTPSEGEGDIDPVIDAQRHKDDPEDGFDAFAAFTDKGSIADMMGLRQQATNTSAEQTE